MKHLLFFIILLAVLGNLGAEEGKVEVIVEAIAVNNQYLKRPVSIHIDEEGIDKVEEGITYLYASDARQMVKKVARFGCFFNMYAHAIFRQTLKPEEQKTALKLQLEMIAAENPLSFVRKAPEKYYGYLYCQCISAGLCTVWRRLRVMYLNDKDIEKELNMAVLGPIMQKDADLGVGDFDMSTLEEEAEKLF